MKIDWGPFMMAFGRDVNFHDAYPLSTYLDQCTGDVMWVYDCNDHAYTEDGVPAEDNREKRERVAMEPERYLEIPGCDHGEHHEILQQFLGSNWTDDDALRQRADEAYFRSIGGWKEVVGDEEAVHAFREFREFREAEIARRAEKFLRENGIAPEWT